MKESLEEYTKAVTEARLLETERQLEKLLLQGEQVHTLRQYPDGRITAIVSPVGQLFTSAIEVDVQGPL